MNYPTFEPEEALHPGCEKPCAHCPRPDWLPCKACKEDGFRDKPTGLCRPCWRVRVLMAPIYIVGPLVPGDRGSAS